MAICLSLFVSICIYCQCETGTSNIGGDRNLDKQGDVASIEVGPIFLDLTLGHGWRGVNFCTTACFASISISISARRAIPFFLACSFSAKASLSSLSSAAFSALLWRSLGLENNVPGVSGCILGSCARSRSLINVCHQVQAWAWVNSRGVFSEGEWEVQTAKQDVGPGNL